MHLVRGGHPPIVFVAQLGGGADTWDPIIDRLKLDATLFAYDRPGTGDAPPRPAPNPPLPHGAFADELAALLDQHGITQPAIIVGHSFGGNIAKVYAGRYPDRVAGMVFVDSSIPQTFLNPATDQPTIDGDGPDATHVDRVAGQVEILTAGRPAVPAVVLTRKRHWWYPTYQHIPNPAMDDLWQVSQRMLAEQWQAPLIVADDAGHQIPREAPDLVVHAVRAVHAAICDGEQVHFDGDELAKVGAHLAN